MPCKFSVVTQLHVFCYTCAAKPGLPCEGPHRSRGRFESPVLDYDGECRVHVARIRRGDDLAEGNATWRYDELIAVVQPRLGTGKFVREGRPAPRGRTRPPFCYASAGPPVSTPVSSGASCTNP